MMKKSLSPVSIAVKSERMEGFVLELYGQARSILSVVMRLAEPRRLGLQSFVSLPIPLASMLL